MHRFVRDDRSLTLLEAEHLRKLDLSKLEVAVAVQMQVRVLYTALDHVPAQVVIQLELVADDQPKSYQVVMLKDAEDDFNKLNGHLVKLDLFFLFEFEIQLLVRPFPDMHLIQLVSDLLGEQADVVNDLLDDFVLDFLVFSDEPHMLTAFHAAIETQNRHVIPFFAFNYRVV